MSGTYTTRTGTLYKPAVGDTVSVTTDVNNNLDVLDTYAMGFAQVTNAAARPTTVWPGLCVFQTADSTTWVSNGSAPASASWISIPNSTSSSTVNVTGAATGTDVISVNVTADTQKRLIINAGGLIEWGSGTATVDTNLYRNTTDELKTDDNFTSAKNLALGGTPSIGGGVGVLGILNAATPPASNPTGGVIAYSSSGQLLTRNPGGLVQRINGAVGISPAASSLSSFTAESAVATIAIPANDAIVGATYRIRVWGVASTTGTPTYQFRTRIGWVSSGTPGSQLSDGGTITTASGIATREWMVDAYLVCLTAGVSGSFFGQHAYWGHTSTAGTGTPELRMDGVAAQTGIDTTAAQTYAVTVACSASSASNIIAIKGAICERVQ